MQKSVAQIGAFSLFSCMAKYFYRVEHKETHIGPYRNSTDGRYLSAAWEISGTTNWDLFSGGLHPLPSEDNIDLIDFSMVFGFPSLRKLTNWFSNREDVWEILRRAGFQVVRFEASDGRMDGRKQSCISYKNLFNRTVVPFDRVIGY